MADRATEKEKKVRKHLKLLPRIIVLITVSVKIAITIVRR
jgi:hypothetical protein